MSPQPYAEDTCNCPRCIINDINSRTGHQKIYPLPATPPPQEGMEQVHCTKDNFIVTIDVHLFSPDELEVHSDEDFLIVRGEHEEEEVRGTLTKNKMDRRYFLPRDADPEDFNCEITSHGILQVTVPRHSPTPPSEEEDGGNRRGKVRFLCENDQEKEKTGRKKRNWTPRFIRRLFSNEA